MLPLLVTVVSVMAAIEVMQRVFKPRKKRFDLSTVGLIAVLLPPALAITEPVDPWALVVFSTLGVILLLWSVRPE